MFQEIREKRGLVYLSIYSFPTFYTGAGLFGIAAATDNEQVNKMPPVIADEIKNCRTSGQRNRTLARQSSGEIGDYDVVGKFVGGVLEKLARQLLFNNCSIPIAETIPQNRRGEY